MRPARPAVAVLTVVSLGLVVLGEAATVATPGLSGPDLLSSLLFLLLPVSFVVVGGVLGTRLPGHPVGRLCAAIGLLWAAQSWGYATAAWLGSRGLRTAAEWIGLLGTLWLPAAVLTGTHLLLRLPAGTLASSRWRWFSRACTTVLVATTALTLTAPGAVADVPGTRNPIGAEPVQAFAPLYLLVPVVVLGSIASLVVRYRQASGVERLQIRVIAFGGAGLLAVLAVAILPTTLGWAAEGSGPAFLDAVLPVAFSGLPLAIGVAVLRYRLYDLGVVVNKTLVYGLLTGTMVAVYVGSVLLLQVLLSGATGGSGLSVALSTLAAAAVFRPARARIQRQVDKRFYRGKYDAARVVADFAGWLQHEVELTEIVGRVRTVLGDTVSPASASVWIRDAVSPPAPGPVAPPPRR